MNSEIGSFDFSDRGDAKSTGETPAPQIVGRGCTRKRKGYTGYRICGGLNRRPHQFPVPYAPDLQIEKLVGRPPPAYVYIEIISGNRSGPRAEGVVAAAVQGQHAH